MAYAVVLSSLHQVFTYLNVCEWYQLLTVLSQDGLSAEYVSTFAIDNFFDRFAFLCWLLAFKSFEFLLLYCVIRRFLCVLENCNCVFERLCFVGYFDFSGAFTAVIQQFLDIHCGFNIYDSWLFAVYEYFTIIVYQPFLLWICFVLSACCPSVYCFMLITFSFNAVLF